MAEPIGAARVELSASAAAFAKDMARARKAVSMEAGKMSRAFNSLTDRTARLSREIFSIRTATVAAVGAGGLALLVRKAIATADSIGKTADKLGIGVEALQELRHAAARAGIEQGTFDMALQRFIRRAGEAAQGTGEAKDAIAQLGLQLTDAQGRMRPTEDLLGDVADAFTRIEDPAQRLRIAFKLFDSEGVQMVNVLRDGASGIDRMRERARALGVVISEEMVRRAEKANDQLDDMADVFKVAGTNLALEFMPDMQELGRNRTDPAFINGIRDMGDELRGALEWIVNNQDTIIRVFGALSGFLLGSRLGPQGAIGGAIAGAFGPEVMGALNALGIGPAQAKALGISGDAMDTGFVPPGASLAAGGKPPGPPITFGGAGAEKSQKVIDNLKHELSLVTMTNEQRQVSNALKQAGVKLDSEQGRRISMLVQQIGEQSRAMRTLEDVTNTVAFSMESAFDQFIETGKVDFKAMIDSMLKDLARLAFRLAVIEPLVRGVTGSVGGAIAGRGMALPGFARGGSFRVGGAGGMDSQIAAMRVTPGEMVTVSKKDRGMSGGGITVNQQNTFETGMTAPDMARIRQMIAQSKREAEAGAVSRVRGLLSQRSDALQR